MTEQTKKTPIKHLFHRPTLRAVQYTGHNARDVAEFTGGKFEANGDGALFLDKTADVSLEIEPGTWIIHVPWSPVPYQYVSDAEMRKAFVIVEMGEGEERAC